MVILLFIYKSFLVDRCSPFPLLLFNKESWSPKLGNLWLFRMGKYGYSVYLGGISDRVRTGDVEDFFKGYGKILDVALKSKYGDYFDLASLFSIFFYLAFIEFEDKYDAEDAVKDLDGTKLKGTEALNKDFEKRI